MQIAKQVLRLERLRQVPEQFSWVDQALVQHHHIDRCDSPSAALYLFLITVADAQGLSYYGASTLASRLHLSAEELTLARERLIELDLIAYQAPLYQVLAIAGTQAAPSRSATGIATSASASSGRRVDTASDLSGAYRPHESGPTV